MTTAAQILEFADLDLGTASKSQIRAIYHAADDGGVIQADAMVRLFPGQPTRHTTCELAKALVWAGAKAREV
ncbi:MAG: hypothetical protein JWN13_5403 [Betaproteobacteria bacterium]|nr:hypothetical protein [Betaproteobacteria bacterium]